MNEQLQAHLEPHEVAAYVDGRADPALVERVTTHMSECFECRDEIVATSGVFKAYKRRYGIAAWFFRIVDSFRSGRTPR